MANENVISRKSIKVLLRDGKEYAIEPLTLNELIKVWPIIQKLEKSQDNMDESMLKDMIELVYVALQKKVEKEKVGDLVDLVDLQIIIAAIVGQDSSKLKAQ